MNWLKEDRRIHDFFHNLKGSKNLGAFIRRHCGKFIDKGLYRDVYELKESDRYVVKIEETHKGGFCNVIEWRIWQDNEEWKAFSKYLCPVIAIDETGQILIQRRVKLKSIKEYPDKMPSIFSDFKIQNYGFIGNQIVCIDYGGLLSRAPFEASLKLKKVKWWDINDK